MEEEECDCGSGGAPAWMATFSDMATLLLTFFVLLLSFANMDIENFKVALGSVKEALGVQVKIDGQFEGFTTSPVQLNSIPSGSQMRKERKANNQLKAVEAYVRSKNLERKVDVLDTARGIVLRIKDVVLFSSGEADLKEGAEPILEMVKELFGVFDGQLVVEGHTDDRPINTVRFPSNWELSTGRASAVVQWLIGQKLPARRLSVAGYADVRPIATNKTDAGRAANRRVEFVFQAHWEQGGKKRRAKFKTQALEAKARNNLKKKQEEIRGRGPSPAPSASASRGPGSEQAGGQGAGQR